MLYNGIEITSQVIGVGKRKTNDNFKGEWFSLYPKHIVTVNGEDFDFSGSSYDLAVAFGLNQSALYLHDGVIYHDSGYGKRNNNKSPAKTFQTLIAQYLARLNVNMTDEDLLFALRYIIQDALVTFENADIGEFADSFGYTDIKECLKVWNACSDTRARLKMSEAKLHEILDKLSEDGIE